MKGAKEASRKFKVHSTVIPVISWQPAGFDDGNNVFSCFRQPNRLSLDVDRPEKKMMTTTELQRR